MNGYSTKQEANKLWNATLGKVIISCNIAFEEYGSGTVHAKSILKEASRRNCLTEPTPSEESAVNYSNNESGLNDDLFGSPKSALNQQLITT